MTTQTPAAPGAAPPAQITENTIPLWDGTEIFYRAWLPAQPAERTLIMFHRGHEHSARFLDVVEDLGLENTAVYAWDARGHGRSPGDRGYAPSFGCMVKDIDSFVGAISERHEFKVEDTVVLAHSVGAVSVSTWLHDYAPRVRGAILATPALRVKLYVPFALPALRLMQRLKKGKRSYVQSYVKSKMLTHDAAQAERYNQDPLITRSIAVNILIGMYDAATRIMADAGAIRTPILQLGAGADWVVKKGSQERFFESLGSPTKKLRVFDGMYHDILHEKDRHLVLAECKAFLDELYANPPERAPLLDADRQGYTKTEYDALERPLAWWSPKRWSFALQSGLMKTVGRLSKGIRLGWKSGFDSGRTLDYVYENRPQGALGLGWLLDRSYLKSVGWEGIRRRKLHLEQILDRAIRELQEQERPVRIMDIAAGAGRYVLETLATLPKGAATAVLRDYQAPNLDVGRRIADEHQLEGVTFLDADAFDEDSLAATDPAPTVGIVSGLYELFPENDGVRRSLRGLARALAGGGYLIYTNQPWHPQVEMIARVLVNREGVPWVMRRRTQEEMDDLVREAGFEKIAQEIDEFGIFTVSLARLGGGDA